MDLLKLFRNLFRNLSCLCIQTYMFLRFLFLHVPDSFYLVKFYMMSLRQDASRRKSKNCFEYNHGFSFLQRTFFSSFPNQLISSICLYYYFLVALPSIWITSRNAALTEIALCSLQLQLILNYPLTGIGTSRHCRWNGWGCYVRTGTCWTRQPYWGDYQIGRRFCYNPR